MKEKKIKAIPVYAMDLILYVYQRKKGQHKKPESNAFGKVLSNY